jgi:hypothetical protein
MAGAAIKIFLNQIEKDIQIAICTGVNTILEKQTDKIGGIITENLNNVFKTEGIKKQLETLVTKQFSTIFESDEINNIFQTQITEMVNKKLSLVNSNNGAVALAGSESDVDEPTASQPPPPPSSVSRGGRKSKSRKSRKSKSIKLRKR